MQVTINIPDSVAQQAAKQGLSPESYSENLIKQQVDRSPLDQSKENHTDIERFLREFPVSGLPVLRNSSFTRETMYDDHD